MTANKKYTIYGLRGRGENTFFYIGSTFHDLDRRLGAHIYEVKLGAKCHDKRVVMENFSYDIEIVPIKINVCNKTTAINEERKLIAKYKKDGHPLVNYVYVTMGIKTRIQGRGVLEELTDDRILQNIANGFTASEISKKYCMSTRTIEGRVLLMRKAYNAKSVTHLVATAIRKKIIK